jgi:UDP-N-acetylmuramate dehydrogenase
VVLAAEFLMRSGDPAQIRAAADRNRKHRQETQPAGKSAGSVFKRTRDHPAGYLIEEAGLKGSRVGDAVVSDVHANFVLNLGGASAEDVRRLIDLVRITVHERFGVWLELEVQLVGEW